MDPLNDDLRITRDSIDDAQVRKLLERHHTLMRSTSPEESCHVMDPAELISAGVVLFSARSQGQVLGVGALKEIGTGHGELKSMHTAVEARGRGVARRILNALIDEARARGLIRLSLETGSDDMFAPARALYFRHGFDECPPFGAYKPDPLSTFMTRVI